jgi:hypothetical protein
MKKITRDVLESYVACHSMLETRTRGPSGLTEMAVKLRFLWIC